MVVVVVVMVVAVERWLVESVVISCPSGKAERGVPGALQFEAHPCVRPVGLSPVFGKLPCHLLSVAGGERLEGVDEALASLREPLLIGFCRNLHARARGGG